MNLEQVKQLKLRDKVILAGSTLARVAFVSDDVIVVFREQNVMNGLRFSAKNIAFSLTDEAGFRAWTLPRKPFDETIPYVHPTNEYTTGIQLRETPSGLFEIAWIGAYPTEYVRMTREQLKLRAELFLRAYNHPQAVTPLTHDFVPQSDPTKE